MSTMACFLVNNLNLVSKKGDRFHSQKSVCPGMQMDSVRQKGNVVLPGDCDLRLGSPAKINLFLRIIGKRPDGFHDLASLFQSISLHDTLYFHVKEDGYDNALEDSLECKVPGVPTDSSNLVIKALEKFREKTGSQKYFHVRLEKEIPYAAGLGGGSGNAATALWASNELNGRPCSTQDLVEFGAEFGSDVSFFLSSGTAYCTGRGEILEEIPQLTQRKVYIVKPPLGLSTRQVFKTLDLSQCSKKDPKQLLERMQQELNPSDFINDLENPSFCLLPRLKVLKENLGKAGFDIVMMSGSGTSFFCLGEPRDREHFQKVFPVENNVRVYEARFQGRPSSKAWYFE